MKKVWALVLSLMLMCSLLPVNAEQLAGGWNVSTESAVTEEAAAALNAATTDWVGATYEPVALLGTQVVAGINYCLLCRVTPVVPDAVPHYAIVYVWQAVDGHAELLKVADVNMDAADEMYEDGTASNFAYVQDEQGDIYDLFEITKLLMDESKHVYGVEGHYAVIAYDETEEYDYAKRLPEEYSYTFSDDFYALMLDNDLEYVVTDDIYSWYVNTYLEGEEPTEGEELSFWFVTVRIELNEDNEINYMEGVYVPWG